MDRKTINRKTAQDAIKFLDEHMLDPTPSNYAFAYLYLTGISGALRKAVDGVCDGGLRLSQNDVDELLNMAPGETGHGAVQGGHAPDVPDAAKSALRGQLMNFADLTTTAIAETSRFNHDLADSARKIDGEVDLVSLIGTMMERTADMERRLTETRHETERLRQDLDAARDDATRDALTNLPNRRAIDRQLKAISQSAMPLSLAFCDIDHFKAINDRFGHAVGDRVLKAVAETLSETVAPHVVGRFGGEEFVVVLDGVDGARAYELIERAREAVSARSLRVRETDELIGAVTFSAGIADCDGEPEETLRLADQLLYEAKSSGRNCTVYRVLA